MFMHGLKKLITIAVAVLVVTSSALMVSFRTAGQASKIEPDIEQKRKEFRKQFPTARYDAPEEQDIARRARRQLAGKRYENGGGLVESTIPIAEDEERMLINDEYLSVPAIPVNESELIVIGQVLGAAAHLSNNKKNVYSEFTVQIDEILRDTTGNAKKEGFVTLDREGGFVKYRKGLRRLHRIGGLLMPQVGGKYILFLKNREKGPNYEIINGYELRDGGVRNLTGSIESRSYSGINQAILLSTVRKALSEASQSKSEKEN